MNTPSFIPKISTTILDYANDPTFGEITRHIIAAGVVATYLNQIEFQTDTSQKETATDLFISGIGYLECRSLLPGETEIHLTSEAIENKIGCVLVELEQEPDKAKILGFVPADDEGNLAAIVKLEDLQFLEKLTELLENLEYEVNFT